MSFASPFSHLRDHAPLTRFARAALAASGMDNEFAIQFTPLERRRSRGIGSRRLEVAKDSGRKPCPSIYVHRFNVERNQRMQPVGSISETMSEEQVVDIVVNFVFK